LNWPGDYLLTPSEARSFWYALSGWDLQFCETADRGNERPKPIRRSIAGNSIEHRLTKVKHPWTNGQVERMNRTIKEATVKRFHYDDHAQLKKHLADFIDAYNFGRRLKTLKGLTPYEFVCKRWTLEPDRFIIDPIHQMPILNI
jgi:hypothetical protein